MTNLKKSDIHRALILMKPNSILHYAFRRLVRNVNIFIIVQKCVVNFIVIIEVHRF